MGLLYLYIKKESDLYLGHEVISVEQRYSSTHSSLWNLVKVNGQLHSLPTLPPGKTPLPIGKEAGCLQSRFDSFGEEVFLS